MMGKMTAVIMINNRKTFTMKIINLTLPVLVAAHEAVIKKQHGSRFFADGKIIAKLNFKIVGSDERFFFEAGFFHGFEYHTKKDFARVSTAMSHGFLKDDLSQNFLMRKF